MQYYFLHTFDTLHLNIPALITRLSSWFVKDIVCFQVLVGFFITYCYKNAHIEDLTCVHLLDAVGSGDDISGMLQFYLN